MASKKKSASTVETVVIGRAERMAKLNSNHDAVIKEAAQKAVKVFTSSIWWGRNSSDADPRTGRFFVMQRAITAFITMEQEAGREAPAREEARETLCERAVAKYGSGVTGIKYNKTMTPTEKGTRLNELDENYLDIQDLQGGWEPPKTDSGDERVRTRNEARAKREEMQKKLAAAS